MKPSLLAQRLRAYFLSREPQPCFIWGPPGCAKSSVVYQTTQELKYELKVFIASTIDPVDLRGVMFIEDGETVFAPPRDFKPGRIRTVYFFDELNTATPAVQASMLRLILEGRLGDIDISTQVRVGAGNRAIDLAAVNRMPSPLVNRFHHLYMDPDFEDWKQWAYRNDVESSIIAFHNFTSGSKLYVKPAERDRPFPSPRSWHFLSNTIKILGGVENLLYEDVMGNVGEGLAAEYLGFLEVYATLPKSADQVMGKKLTYTKEPSKQHAVNGMITSFFARCSDKAKVAKDIIEYAAALDHREFAVILLRDVMHVDAKVIMAAPGYVAWAKDIKELVL